MWLAFVQAPVFPLRAAGVMMHAFVYYITKKIFNAPAVSAHYCPVCLSLSYFLKIKFVSILLSQQMFQVYIRIMLNFYEDDKGLYLTPTYRLTAKYPGRLLTVAHLEKEVRAFISTHLGCSS